MKHLLLFLLSVICYISCTTKQQMDGQAEYDRLLTNYSDYVDALTNRNDSAVLVNNFKSKEYKRLAFGRKYFDSINRRFDSFNDSLKNVKDFEKTAGENKKIKEILDKVIDFDKSVHWR